MSKDAAQREQGIQKYRCKGSWLDSKQVEGQRRLQKLQALRGCQLPCLVNNARFTHTGPQIRSHARALLAKQICVRF